MIRPWNPSADAEAPAVVEELVRRAEAAGASDLHLQMAGAAARVDLRLDGLLAPYAELGSPLAEHVCGRIKFLARLKTYQDSLPQDGRIDRAEVGAAGDIRVSTYPTVTGEKIVLRFFSRRAAPNLAGLGLSEAARQALERCLGQTAGLLLLTGPAGSGKTTTIYACLQHLAGLAHRQIITIEDPVEQILPGIMQTEIHEERGLTFAKAARHLLRQDPEVLVVGEIRDEETAQLVVRAGLTGHLVIATLHAGSCAGVLERLLLLCPDRSAVISALALIFNQRLVRRVCAACGGGGCGACLQTGYQGRIPIAEWFACDAAGRARIRLEGSPALQAAWALAQSARQLVDQRLTTHAECQRVLGDAYEVS